MTTALRTLRRHRLYSLRGFAKEVGISVPSLLDIELGRSEPKLETCRKLAEALGVDPMTITECRRAVEHGRGS